MSDKHDHSHDHDHGDGHDHGHTHDHDHDHGHDHGHSHGEIKLPSEKKPAEPTPPPVEFVEDDAGSRALSEALRSSFAIVKILMIFLVIAFFASGIFTVTSQQKAIVLRFGKPLGTGPSQLLGPGLHFSLPAPIDEIVRIPIGEIQTVQSTAGWYQTTAEAEASNMPPEDKASLSPAVDGYTITSDGNIVHVRAVIHYRIVDPLSYVLKFAQATNVVQNLLDEALFFASSQYTVDQALTADRQGFKEKVMSRVRQVADERGLGITIEQGDVTVVPPTHAKAAFLAALTAEIDRRKAIDDANSYAGKVLSTAEGQASSIVNAGQTDRARMVQGVGAEAQYYKDQLPHYLNNRALFVARVQTETLARVMTNVQDKWFLPSTANGKAQELRLLLNREPQKAVAPQDQPEPGQQGR